MQMQMIHKILSPGVQDTKEADLCTQVLGIPGQIRQRLGYGLEDQRIPMLEGHRQAPGNTPRQRTKDRVTKTVPTTGWT